mmetsp:Transcript_22584/g.67259  ORF Transcript_22584/g.67259 Transcript_22584/m.67259 type:complete len:315 (+) Transcript_22584:759-1703(+)|eukprot:352616-Chlamydomonas_euryale.AAC.9
MARLFLVFHGHTQLACQGRQQARACLVFGAGDCGFGSTRRWTPAQVAPGGSLLEAGGNCSTASSCMSCCLNTFAKYNHGPSWGRCVPCTVTAGLNPAPQDWTWTVVSTRRLAAPAADWHLALRRHNLTTAGGAAPPGGPQLPKQRLRAAAAWQCRFLQPWHCAGRRERSTGGACSRAAAASWASSRLRDLVDRHPDRLRCAGVAGAVVDACVHRRAGFAWHNAWLLLLLLVVVLVLVVLLLRCRSAAAIRDTVHRLLDAVRRRIDAVHRHLHRSYQQLTSAWAEHRHALVHAALLCQVPQLDRRPLAAFAADAP